MDSKDSISSDSPITDPSQDRFGFSRFANRISAAINSTPCPDGIVLAVNAPWGSGKSSLLNLIKFNLKSMGGEASPIIIDFNAWWFGDHDQLARQILSVFSVEISKESKNLRKVGNLISEYSSAISSVIAFATGYAWLDKPVSIILKVFRLKLKQLPQLKHEISQRLLRNPRRILFVIDDLDRLAPDEVREVFKVVKAIADFPNVIYLLAFDQRIVSGALSTSLRVNGDEYLEKIIQAKFSLPAISAESLQKKLWADVFRIATSIPGTEFDVGYWGNIYFDGLFVFFKNPRDVARIVNTISVTCPAVAGEVNLADFIALEVLRVFCSSVYETIKEHRKMFTGVTGASGASREQLRDFHRNWLNSLEHALQLPITNIITRIFPKVGGVLGKMTYGEDWLQIWSKNRRACSDSFFDLYFQFASSESHLLQREFTQLVESSADRPVFVEMWRLAKSRPGSNGNSKSAQFIDRLTSVADGELTSKQVVGIIESVFLLNEDLLPQSDDSGLPRNSWRVMWLLRRLFEQIPIADREPLLRRCIEDSRAYSTVMTVINFLGADSDSGAIFDGISELALKDLQKSFIMKLNTAEFSEIIESCEADDILQRWIDWGDPEFAKERLAAAIATSDVNMMRFLVTHLRRGSAHSIEDRVATLVFSLDTERLEKYIPRGFLRDRLLKIHPTLKGLEKIAADKYIEKSAGAA
ncbi:KAP family P-loop NTPase fold protein [Paracidovorax oryzae]|uniref:KAP family P-loop NTPase fold protein n=1 Tax=Paracidovorax oryzae TaxID=862720 RepID=UPI0009DA44D2|nr:KAP family NTPase [Paracidovorax oryzae]